MAFTYDSSIPNASHPPKDDQSPMQVNFQSIQSLIDVDHSDFGNSDAGIHNQCRFPTAAVTPAYAPGTGALYAAGIMAKPGSYPTWVTNGMNLILATNDASNTGNGYAPLPGGLMIQWGNSGGSPVTFPIAFTSAPYSINVTIVGSGTTGTITTNVAVTSSSTTGFNFSVNVNNVSSPRYFWMAIGSNI